MNVGKTLLAQVMEFVPWETFGRIIKRHKDDAGIHTLGCADLFRLMAFAQLTWRESMRDIERDKPRPVLLIVPPVPAAAVTVRA